MSLMWVLAGWVISLGVPAEAKAQAEITRYAQFEIQDKEVVWKNSYPLVGSADSIRRIVVQMLKSKFFTFNVIRNEVGYNGELRHYKVDCAKYGRTYFNTPRMYWEGEWTGKFTVEVFQGSYNVTVFALYYERMEKSTGYYRTEKPVKGRYFEGVTTKNNTSFRKNELANLSLIGASLKDDFDVKQSTPIR